VFEQQLSAMPCLGTLARDSGPRARARLQQLAQRGQLGRVAQLAQRRLGARPRGRVIICNRHAGRGGHGRRVLRQAPVQHQQRVAAQPAQVLQRLRARRPRRLSQHRLASCPPPPVGNRGARGHQ